MSREFKLYNKMFTPQELEDERSKWSHYVTHFKWPHPVQQWSHKQVRHAVYEAPDALSWQRFRVALKGLPTSVKLSLLSHRLATLAREDNQYGLLEMCRIDNYIGALVRGGFLDSDYNVIH